MTALKPVLPQTLYFLILVSKCYWLFYQDLLFFFVFLLSHQTDTENWICLLKHSWVSEVNQPSLPFRQRLHSESGEEQIPAAASECCRDGDRQEKKNCCCCCWWWLESPWTSLAFKVESREESQKHTVMHVFPFNKVKMKIKILFMTRLHNRIPI